MEKFIYVFDTASRDALLREGFLLLKADEENDVYVFENDVTKKAAMSFALGGEHALSDTLTF